MRFKFTLAILILFFNLNANALQSSSIYSVDAFGEIYVKEGSDKCQGYRTGIFVLPDSDEIVWSSQREATELDSICGVQEIDQEPYKICKRPNGTYQDWRFYRDPYDVGPRRYSVVGVDFNFGEDVYIYNSRLCGKGQVDNSVSLNIVDVPYPEIESELLNFEIVGPTILDLPPPPEEPHPTERGLHIHASTFKGKVVKIQAKPNHAYPRGIFLIMEVKAEGDFKIDAGDAPIHVGFITLKDKVTLNNSPLSKIKFTENEKVRARNNLIENLKRIKGISKKNIKSYIKKIKKNQVSATNLIYLSAWSESIKAVKEIDIKSHGVELSHVALPHDLDHELHVKGGASIELAYLRGDVRIHCKKFRAYAGTEINGSIDFGDPYDMPAPIKPCKNIEIRNSIIESNVLINGNIKVNNSEVKGLVTLKGNLDIASSVIGDEANTTESILIDANHGYLSSINKSMIFPPGTYKGWMSIGGGLNEEDDSIAFRDNNFDGAFQLDSSMLHTTIHTGLPSNPEDAPVDKVIVGIGASIGVDSHLEEKGSIESGAIIGSNANLTNATIRNCTIGTYANWINSSVGNHIQGAYECNIGNDSTFENVIIENFGGTLAIGNSASLTQTTVQAPTSIGDEVSINKASFYAANIGDAVVVDGQTATVNVYEGTISDGCVAKGEISILYDSKILNGASLQSTTGSSMLWNGGILTGADVTGRLILNGVSFSTSGFHEKHCFLDLLNQYQCEEL